MAMTSSPSSVSSWAMIDPVQPRPMMTTSFLGSLRAMVTSPRFRRPLCATSHADRRQRKALVVAIDPVQVVVTGSGVADHFPCDHVAIAAVDWVGEKAHLKVFDDFGEKRLSVGAVELQFAAFKIAKHFILVAIGQVSELLARIFRLARLIERREARAVILPRTALRLVSLILHARLKRRPKGTAHLFFD